jgi:ABC-type transport system involved in cytochrome bd biosynthesis fused ATPase/permease subunit
MLEREHYGLARLSRWTARAIATIAGLFFVVMLIGSALSEGVGPATTESVTLVLLAAVALAGSTVSWWRDMTAGILLVLTSIGFGVHIACFAGHNHVLAWFIIGFPYLAAGILILSAWQFSRQHR